MFLGPGDSGSSSFQGLLEQIEWRIEKSAGQWVKAVLDSSLAQLGTVGAMAVEEFVSKMKEAIREVMVGQVAVPLGAMSRRASDSLPPDIGSASGVLPEVESIPGGSTIPTAFGGPSSVAAGGGPAAVVSSLKKPGKQLQVPDYMKCYNLWLSGVYKPVLVFLVGAFINKRARLLQSLVALVFFKTDSKRRTLKLKLLDRQTGSAFRIVQRVPPFSYSIFQKCY